MAPLTILASCITLCLLACAVAAPQGLNFETPTFAWKITGDARTTSLFEKSAARELCAFQGKTFSLITADGAAAAEDLRLEGDRLTVRFTGGAGECAFRVTTGKRHVLLKLLGLKTRAPFERLTLCRLLAPREGTIAGTLNAWRDKQSAVAVLGLSPNVRPGSAAGRSGGQASPGASAEASPTEDAKVGKAAAHLVGKNPTDKVGWTCWSRNFDAPLDLRGTVGIGAWVKGDGKGEALKIQLFDGKSAPGHYRDYYIPLDFTGWKYCELPMPPGEPIDYSHILACNLYFNNIPQHADVECIVDEIRALRSLTGKPSENPDDIVLASFEDPELSYFDQPATILSAECLKEFGTEGAGVAVIACPVADLGAAIEEVELAAGLPCPRFKGAWNKTSPDVKGSYLFITSFGIKDTDAVIDYARKCGFTAILVGDSSWTTSVGHFPINTQNFPGGIADLKAVMDRFHAAGFRCGLHFLSAAIYANDAYVTPIPDKRLVMDRFTDLKQAVDAKADFIPTLAPPQDFPPQEGGYTGDSAILRIGDELISYGSVSLKQPFGFVDCRRGLYNTKAAPHKPGDRIAHVKRGYGFFLHDMNTTLTAEVAANFAKVFNAIGADMAYFDGAEAMQDPHWYYNSKLVKSYWDAIGREDVLLQASSFSPFSWHILSREASADGHGDLKGYLDERIPAFLWYADNLMPLDLGWYYIYDAGYTPDQYEYVCQKALGYDCSVSIQTNPDMIAHHPRMDEIIKLVRTYDDLRRSGQVPEEMRAKLRKPGEGYVLSMSDGKPTFRRAAYFPPVGAVSCIGPATLQVKVDPQLGTPHLGVELRAGRRVAPGPDYDAADNWLLEDFEDLTPYGAKGEGENGKLRIGTNLAGSTSPGVTQTFESITEGAKLGKRCGKFTATSARRDDGGWSAIGKRFDKPLDLRAHVGLGVWICGDNSGAFFKIQPRDKAGHAQDYYITIDFTGWRYFILKRPEVPYPEPIVYDAISYLTLYYNNLPAGKTCTILVDGLKALRTISESEGPAPQLVLAGKTVAFDTTLGTDDWLLYNGGPTATLKRPGQKPRTVVVTGDLAPLQPGENAITINPSGAAPQTHELSARAGIVYE